MIIRINYYFQKKEKYIKKSITKDLMKQENQTKKIDYYDLIFITERKNRKTKSKGIYQQILIGFLMEETMLLNLLKTMVQ